MAIKNVIFDIGNVLTVFAWAEHYKNHGLTGEIYEKVVRATVKNPLWNEFDRGVMAYKDVVEEMCKKEPDVAEEIRDVLLHTHGIVTAEAFAIPWVKDLKDRGYHVYYLSNFSDGVREGCKDALEFTEYMDGGVFSYLEKLIKPDPAIYQVLLQRYDLKPEESVFLDDTEENLVTARSLGIHTIRVDSHEQAAADLEALLQAE